MIGDLTLSVNALGVDPKHDVDAVTGALRRFRGVDPGVEPEGHGRVAQVIWPGRERRGDLLGRQRVRPCLLPDLRVGRGRDDAAGPRAEEPTVLGRPVRLQVRAQDRDQFRRDGDDARSALRTVLEASFVEPLPRIGDPLAALRPGLLQRQQPQPDEGR